VSACRKAGSPGLTLIELIFAVSVIAVAMLAIASMFPTALRALVGGGHETRATALARGMMDMLRSEPFDRLADAVPSGYNGFTTTSLSPACPVASPASPDADYIKKKWTCEVGGPGVLGNQGLPGGVGTVGVVCLNPDGSTGTCSSTDLRRLAVTVSWQLGQGQGTRAIVLVTYVVRQE
jgi:prepilin-type N-terminal cleavage/methylation domain-containing protein